MSEFGAAISEAQDWADIVVFVGGLITCQEQGPECQESEALDRSSNGVDVGTGLPRIQLLLLQRIAASTGADTSMVLVINSGSAVSLPFAAASPRVGAIVQQFYSGEEGGAALADVLFGAEAPSGRLPVSVPVSEAQLVPDYLDPSMTASPGRTYRYYNPNASSAATAGARPGPLLFPFGFGLGYSTFTYTQMSASVSVPGSTAPTANANAEPSVVVTVDVKNNGEFSKKSSAHVVMVFVVPPQHRQQKHPSSVPRQQLAAFTRVTLAPRETVTVHVSVPAARLRFADPSNSREPKLMPLDGD